MEKFVIKIPNIDSVESKVDLLTKIINDKQIETKLPKFYSKKEAAMILDVTPKTVTKYCMEGKLKFYQPSRKYLFKLDDIEDFISNPIKKTSNEEKV